MAKMKNVVGILATPESHWVGDGFPVRTIFSARGIDPAAITPFLLLDYAGPKEFPPSTSDKPRGVDQHPHRGFETVTIVYQGELEHRDSSGNSGRIGPGDVQWMTAASGVVHEEKHAAEFTRKGGMFEVIQLWVNLPAREKMSQPRYQEIPAASIPVVTLPDGAGSVRVVAGDFPSPSAKGVSGEGVSGPAKTVTPMSVWDVRLQAERSLAVDLHAGWNALVFLLRGAASVNGENVSRYECAVLSREGEGVRINATEEALILFLSGEPIDEPVAAHGPFVMNTSVEIKQAMIDYQSGKMGRLTPTRS